ncbi:hypothetical protein GDO86_015072 [Hymenochirus boettgeri]|uniref:Uncharacterized protein n=1 Tax=Hymenochirus boettgeri TaxID=247094 RepID=A0A8T2JZR9_9PIPI|nr:hypothetical protein GDO86_015072 [Hymenochirus boettgeri]
MFSLRKIGKTVEISELGAKSKTVKSAQVIVCLLRRCCFVKLTIPQQNFTLYSFKYQQSTQHKQYKDIYNHSNNNPTAEDHALQISQTHLLQKAIQHSVTISVH